MPETSPTVFSDMPCLIELFGHARICGRVSEVSIGGSALLRVDVPAVESEPAFTKYYGLGAVYAITPTDEATMLLAVKAMRPKPIERYQFALPETTAQHRLEELGSALKDEIHDLEAGIDPDFDPTEDQDDIDDDFEDEDDDEEDF